MIRHNDNDHTDDLYDQYKHTRRYTDIQNRKEITPTTNKSKKQNVKMRKTAYLCNTRIAYLQAKWFLFANSQI